MMIQTRLQVKATILFIGFISMCSCAHRPISPSPLYLSSEGRQEGLKQPSGWLALPLNEAPYKDLRRQILADPAWGLQKMKDRGEAHITLLTPPEYQALQNEVGTTRLESALKLIPWTQARWTPVCVGEVSHQNSLRSFFVVLDSPDLLKLRTDLWEKLGRPASFQAEVYEPHITLGFTERDLHRQDGVSKGPASCRAQILKPGQNPQ